jgi:predicted nucleic acid-binding protein
MTVVTDTTPINYLLAIGETDILPQLFETVVIPETVRQEFCSASAPERNRRWIASLPEGFRIVGARHFDEAINLDGGEKEAICLASELHADALLMDERKGRKIATDIGLVVVGTLGVLEKAATRGFLDLETALDALSQTSFRASESLLRAIRERHR